MKKYKGLKDDELNWKILEEELEHSTIQLLLKMIDSGNHWVLAG